MRTQGACRRARDHRRHRMSRSIARRCFRPSRPGGASRGIIAAMTADLWDLRHRMYRHVADSGAVPDRSLIRDWVGDVDRADGLLAEMRDRRLVVLDEMGEVQMLLPFSATATGHRVRSADTSWWANCAWDSLAVPIALGVDVDIDATWIDTGEPVHLAVRNNKLNSDEGFIQWRTPAQHWWDDIVET